MYFLGISAQLNCQLPNLNLETVMLRVEKLSHKEAIFFCNNFIDGAANVIIYYHLLEN